MVFKGGLVFALITKGRRMNNKDVKNQLGAFGLIVRDEEFFERSEAILEQFKTKKTKAKKVSDEEKVEDKADEVTDG